MKTVEDLTHYKKYLASKRKTHSSEIDIIRATREIEKQLDNPNSDLFKFLSSLDEFQKIELLKAIILNDNAENLANEISKILKQQNLNTDLANIIAMHPRHDDSQWLNGLQVKLAQALMHNSKGEKLDDFTYARITKAAASKIPDTTMSTSAKKSILRNINTQFESRVINHTQPYELFKANITTIDPKMLGFIEENIKLDEAEYILISLAIFKEINENKNLYIDDKLANIQNLFLAKDYQNAIAAIKETCENNYDKHVFNAYVPQTADRLIRLQNSLTKTNDTNITPEMCLQNINKKVHQHLNGKFWPMVVDISQNPKESSQEKTKAVISPMDFLVMREYAKFSNAEYIVIAVGVLKNLSDQNPGVDEKINQIIQAYQAADFAKANNLIRETCTTYADNLNALAPDLSNQLIKQQNDLKLEAFYVDYVEPVELLNKSKSAGTLSLSEFKVIEENSKIDKSEYIMVAVGVLQHLSKNNPDIEAQLKQVRKHYLTTDFESANKLISEICLANADKLNALSPNLSSRLINLQNKCTEVNALKNYTRRFFENRVAALYLGTELDVDSVNRITQHFTPNNFQPATDAQQALLHFVNDKIVDPDKNDKELNDILNRHIELQKSSYTFSNKRGRALREGVVNIERELRDEGKSTLVLFSQNKGAMRSLQPNYKDELSEALLRNTLPDIHTFEEGSGSYVDENIRSAYIASISGHTFYFMALLEKYMISHKDSPTLSDDVNHFLHGLAAAYVSMGFHSILEVFDVLKTPMIQEILNNYNVKIDPSFSDNVLEQAFNDTQAYTTQILVRAAMHQELINKTSKPNIFTLITDGNFEKVMSINLSGAELNKADAQNITPIQAIIKSEKFTVPQKIELIQNLVKKGANLDAKNDAGHTLLFDAVIKGQTSVAVLLLKFGANPVGYFTDDLPEISVFELALLRRNYAMATALINADAKAFDPNIDLPMALTPLTKTIMESVIKGKVNQDCSDCLKALLAHSEIEANKKDNNGNIPLFLAVEKNNPDMIKALLSHPKIDLAIKNDDGMDILQFAKEMNNSDAVTAIENALATKNSTARMLTQMKPNELVEEPKNNSDQLNDKNQNETLKTPDAHTSKSSTQHAQTTPNDKKDNRESLPMFRPRT